MKMHLYFLFVSGIFIVPQSVSSGDWSIWRGPNSNGHADAVEKPPTEWSETNNVKWKTPVPGKGHSSPTVIGNQIILTTSDEDAQTQSVVSFDRSTGRQQWLTTVLRGNLPAKIHKKNTHASSTAISDGTHIYSVFFNGDSVYLTALDMSGSKVWHIKTGEFHSRYDFGFATSPIFYGDTVIVTAESEQHGYIAAFRKSDGAEQWRLPRKQGTSYSSPIVAKVAGKEQLVISGQKKVTSYNPATGRQLWQVDGSSPATCGTAVWSDEAVFVSGGFPNKETIAVKADGSGKVLWRNGEKCYEQSMLYVDGYIYALNDGGIAFCWDAETGAEQWKVRLGGPVSSSPIYVDGKVFATNEQGITFVFEATPDSYRQIARNQLGQSGFATPTFVDNQIIIRTAYNRSTGREEWLYCIGE